LPAGWLVVITAGGSVGDQTGHGGVGLVEVLPASDVPLEGPPLLVLGVGVLDADAFRGLLMAGRFPSCGFFGRRVAGCHRPMT
jgi:hypothetical protein